MILHVYFARRFALTLGVVGGICAGILLLLDLVEQVRKFGGDTLSFGQIVQLALLSMPETLYAVLPLIVILATLALYLALARSSELVIARGAGRSALRSLLSPIAVALALGTLAVSVLNPIVAATSQRYDILSETLTGTGATALSIGPEGVWLRQGDAAGQTVIHADRANLDGSVLFGVTFLGYGQNGGPAYRIEAVQARLTDGAWRLTTAKEWLFDAPNPERQASEHAQLTLPSSLTATEILDSFAAPSAVPIWDLPGFIARLETAGFSALKHQVWLHKELALPLLLVAMVLIGAGFTMRPARFGGTGVMIALALTMGFSLFFIRSFAQILGENGQIPVLMAAWATPVAAILLPLGLLLHWEDG